MARPWVGIWRFLLFFGVGFIIGVKKNVVGRVYLTIPRGKVPSNPKKSLWELTSTALVLKLPSKWACAVSQAQCKARITVNNADKLKKLGDPTYHTLNQQHTCGGPFGKLDQVVAPARVCSLHMPFLHCLEWPALLEQRQKTTFAPLLSNTCWACPTVVPNLKLTKPLSLLHCLARGALETCRTKVMHKSC